MNRTIWTIGHSNRTLEEFLAVLAPARIESIADVRRFPGSRKWPHFGGEALRESLGAQGIAYLHLPELGGRRGRAASGSPNTAWRVESFNAYADHMQSEEFREGLARLMTSAEARRTAIMCSEAVPWRCHRRLIADALLVRGWEVVDLMSPTQQKPHPLTEFARVEGERVTSPGGTLFG